MLGVFMASLLFHVDMRCYFVSVDKGWIVVVIPDCHPELEGSVILLSTLIH